MKMSPLSETWIPSGSFKVSRTCNEALDACLGTCVGVAITDKKARAGGLYHIILPELSSDSSPYSEETCARTGMPLFLAALREAGCSAESMEATIAGGALIGNVSALDLQLDLGGRTVEIVQEALKEAGIRIARAETGGYLGAKLSLNLQTLKCEIQPSFPINRTSDRPAPKLTPEKMNEAIARLKPIPQVALKIIRTIQSDQYEVKEIAKQIRQDQVISAKVINLCNSAYVSPTEEIRSIDHALLMLGERLVVQLVLSSSVDQFFAGTPGGYSMTKGGLYHHAVSTAIISEQISKLTRRAEPDVAYTAGLLHDIGKVLLDQYIGSASPLFYRKVLAEGKELLSVEKSVLGITHVEAGVRLAEYWSFPLSLRDAIANHSQPELAEHDKDLAHVVYLADLLNAHFHAGHEIECLGADDLARRLKPLGLDMVSLPGLIAQIPWKMLGSMGYY